VSSTFSPGYVSTVNRVLGINAISTLTSPLYVPGITNDNTTQVVRNINNGVSVGFFQRSPQLFAPVWTNPVTPAPTATSLGWGLNNTHYLNLDRLYTSSSTWPAPTPLINGSTTTLVNGVLNLNNYGTYNFPGVTDRSIYDWTKYNTLQTNWARVRAANYNIEFEQQITPSLYFTAGWLRQDIDEVDNYTLNQLTGATLFIDSNVNNMDGTKNAYFGLPYIMEGQGGGIDTFYQPQTDDNYRALLVYDLDFTQHHNWTKWLGHHKLVGTWQEQDSIASTERWRNGFVGGEQDAALRFVRNPLVPNLPYWNSTTLYRQYYMANPGDAQAMVTHSSSFWGNQGWNGPVDSQVQVWNYNTNAYQTDNLIEQTAFADNGSFRSQRQVKGSSFAMQSSLWNDRLVATFGWRHDDYRARLTSSGALTDIKGVVTTPALTQDMLYVNGYTGLINHDLVMSRWGRWDKLSGSTKTEGGALRLFKDWPWVQNLGGQGSRVSEFLQGLTLYYNHSDNFNPPAQYQTDYFFRPLAKPTGKEKDYGFGFNLFDNKLVVRVNWFETQNLNERTTTAGTLLTRLAYSDTTTGLAWAATVERIRLAMAAGKTLNGLSDPNSIFQNTQWNSDTVWSVTSDAEQRKLYDLIQLPYLYYSGLSLGATQQSKSKGTEIQLTFNPTREWTMKFTGSKDEASYTKVAPQYDDWLAVRMPVWTALTVTGIPDFIDPNNNRHYSLHNFWTGYGFTNVAWAENTDGNTSPQGYYNNVVVSQVATAKALEGAVSPDQRIYHWAFLTNYSFSHGRLRGISVGGSERWESKAAIGYYGMVGAPLTAPNSISVADVTKPVWGDNGNYYTDLWIGYTFKMASGKVITSIRLNCNNALESGRLVATQANFDGSPWAYRIIDPRQWILTAKFTF
jgi:hypothetical protein